MIYPIVKYGDPVLENPGAPVTEFDDKLKTLVADMFESMYEAQGVGLAAPQIGISLRLSVIDTTFKEDPEARLVLADPEVHSTWRANRLATKAAYHSPTSARASRAGQKRSPSARRTSTATGMRREQGEGLTARAFQHEIDHLNGTLYIHHLSSLKRDMMKRKIRRLVRAGRVVGSGTQPLQYSFFGTALEGTPSTFCPLCG